MKKLGCALLVILAFLAGTKWEERSCEKDKRAQLSVVSAEFQKELVSREKAETMAKVIAVENERLRAEKAALEARVKDCKPVPETKRVVPRKKKPRASKPKACEKKVVSKPKEKALTPPKAVTPTLPVPQEETLEQKLSKACGGGPVKFVGGRWICVKDEAKVQPEPTLSVAPAPTDTFFANAVDEETEVQAPVQTSAYVAPVYVAYEPLSRPNCMTEPYSEGGGRRYEAGYQHDNRTNGKCRCGSPGCDLRWPWQR